MIKIDKNFVKFACKVVFDELGFFHIKKYRTDYVTFAEFNDCLFNNFPFLDSDNDIVNNSDDLFDDFVDLFFSVVYSLGFNILHSSSGISFLVPFRKKSLITLVNESEGLYHICNDVVTYLSNGKKIQCYLYQLY